MPLLPVWDFPNHHVWGTVGFDLPPLSAAWASGEVMTPTPDAHAEGSVATQLHTSLAGLKSTPPILILQASSALVSNFLAFLS